MVKFHISYDKADIQKQYNQFLLDKKKKKYCRVIGFTGCDFYDLLEIEHRYNAILKLMKELEIFADFAYL